MQNIPHGCFHKTVIINRAVSGSGKTTLSRCVTEALRARGLGVAVHSTDNFFMRDGRYVFELEKLAGYHKRNLSDFTADLQRGVDVVICDNMNLLPWQSQPYTDAARKYGYRILFLNFLPRELEKHLAAQVITPQKPDAHGLSKELLERFIRNFNDYNDLLDRNTVRDIRRHRVFVWNDADRMVMDTGELAQYFDSDAVITIRPESYQEMKNTLADKVLDIIRISGECVKAQGSKRHFLLTWYGLTDMRAALGLESTDGPVLSALRTGCYTDAVVLGYTNPNKTERGFSGELYKEWRSLRDQPLEKRLAYPRARTQVMVDAICNTREGHALFLSFLRAAKLPVRIRFLSRELSHLNDARAIDRAAREALQLALSDNAEKRITCFLSPGTPVMAYTWAVVSRTNPGLHLHVVSSSNPRKPPEEIELPQDVIPPSISTGGRPQTVNFDAVIHLLGTDTNIPQYFSFLQFPSKRHWIITSGDSGKVAALRRLLPPDATLEVKLVDPFIPAHTRNAVEEIVRSLPPSARIGVNLTGGTKLMFAGGLNACNESPDIEPFYFDIKQNNITFIKTGTATRFRGVAKVDGFFTAVGYDIVTPGYWSDNPIREARREITLKLWERRELFKKLYNNKNFLDYKLAKGKADPPFNFSVSHLIAGLDGEKASLVLDNEAVPVPDCTDFGRYLGGGWLEEYTYLQLLPFLQEKRIFDLRIGAEIVPARQTLEPGKMPFNECDSLFTDGNRLFIVECKAGTVKQEHIQKLENNVKNFGGISAKGLLVSAFPIRDENLLKRISSSRSIKAVDPAKMGHAELFRLILS